jgi:hypothetical protein
VTGLVTKNIKKKSGQICCISIQPNNTDSKYKTKNFSNFVDRGCRMISTTHPHDRILGFLVRVAAKLPLNKGRSKRQHYNNQ